MGGNWSTHPPTIQVCCCVFPAGGSTNICTFRFLFWRLSSTCSVSQLHCLLWRHITSYSKTSCYIWRKSSGPWLPVIQVFYFVSSSFRVLGYFQVVITSCTIVVVPHTSEYQLRMINLSIFIFIGYFKMTFIKMTRALFLQ